MQNRPRRPVMVLALVAVMPAVAGCMLTGQGDGPAVHTALEALAVWNASDATPPDHLPWHDAMVLVGIGAIETTITDTAGFDVPPLPFGRDTTVGDGRAPDWFLTYSDGNGDALVVRIETDGTITFHENQDPELAQEDQTLEAWPVDSDTAMAAARTDDTLDGLATDPDTVLSSIVMPHAGAGAVWMVSAETRSGDGHIVFVNGHTGALMTIGEVIGGANPQHVQNHTFRGNVDPSQPSASHGYEQTGEGYDVHAELVYRGANWPDDQHLDLALVHNGYELSWETRSHESGTTTYHWLDVGDGAYTIQIAPLDGAFPEGAAVAYTLQVVIEPRQ